jgi:hypothetical protein
MRCGGVASRSGKAATERSVARSTEVSTWSSYVTQAKTVKNRLHLGLHAGTLTELEAEITRLVGLGASIAWEEEFPPDIAARFRDVILRDPEGNEFCLGGGVLR